MSTVQSFDLLAESEFLEIFERGEFPLSQWRHRPHVTVAYLYLGQYPLEQAIDMMRAAIKKHNEANGLVGAYHETLTQVWAYVIYAAMAAHSPGDSAKNFFNYHSYLLNKMLPLMFYTHARLMCHQARSEFVQPDLMPLPQVPDASILEARYKPSVGFLPIPPDPVKVVAQTSQSINRNPDFAEAYFMRAQNYIHLKKFDLALADYNKTISLTPDHSGAYYGLGAVYAVWNNDEAALENLQKALDLGFAYIKFIERDPRWDNLRDNAAFQELVGE